MEKLIKQQKDEIKKLIKEQRKENTKRRNTISDLNRINEDKT